MLQAPLNAMHSVSHSLVHRGSAVSCARATRWQPYSSNTASNHASQNWIPHTPASTSSATSSPVTQRPPPTSSNPPLCPPESSRCRPALGRTASVRDMQKSRYINALVDQAVKSLGEIWQPEDIPAVFTSTATPRSPIPTQTTSMPNMTVNPAPAPVAGPSTGLPPSLFDRNSQLPSPVTPSTQPSPVPPRVQQPQPAPTTVPCDSLPARNAPLRSFVLEVLKRSKTSAGVLQTALCYIAAIAHKVPVLAAQERMGLAGHTEPCVEDFIVNGLEEMNQPQQERDLARDDASASADAEQEVRTAHVDMMADCTDAMEGIDASTETVKVVDELELPVSPISPFADAIVAPQPSQTQQRRISGRPQGPSPVLPPLPPLPSPLLCPRRTFLAAVILASKFTQDKCFSNKAWARLAGLPAREISRCERALGAALEWRLWVGKLPSVPASTAGNGSNGTQRTLGRTKTVADISSATPPNTFSLAASHPAPYERSSLGRSRTLPSNCFGEFASASVPTLVPAPAVVSSQTWLDGFSPMDGGRSCPEIPSTVTSGESSDPFFGLFVGLPLHASPTAMSTPGLSYSPASTASSGDPTPMFLMADTPAPSPASASGAFGSDGPWGLGGMAGGVAATVPLPIPGSGLVGVPTHPRVEALAGKSIGVGIGGRAGVDGGAMYEYSWAAA